MSAVTKLNVLFTGYAPVHFVCFQPLYEKLLDAGVTVHVSGGQRLEFGSEIRYDADALYEPFGVPSDRVLPVEEIQDRVFDLLFAANTKMIGPSNVGMRVQLFHGISFRNRAVRDDQRIADRYFLVGPYMNRKFTERGLLQKEDPRGLKIGFLKTDRLLNGQLDRNAILESIGFSGSRPVILYAPTGEKHNSLETMGIEIIDRLLKSEQFDLIVKLHDHPKNKAVDWSTKLKTFESHHTKIARHTDVIPLLFVADLLISDASSVSNEFALLNRPMVFLNVPKLLKRARTRSDSALDLDTWGRKAGPVLPDAKSIVKQVDHELTHPDRHEDIRHRMSADLFYNPGQATEAAVRWVHKTFGQATDHGPAHGQRGTARYDN